MPRWGQRSSQTCATPLLSRQTTNSRSNRRVPAELLASTEWDRPTGCQQSLTLIPNLPSGRQTDVMAHHVEHETIKGTEAARHLERVDQLSRAGHIQGDGLSAGLSELNVEPKPFGAMPRELHETLGAERAFKDKTRVFSGHRRLVRLSVRALDRTGIADGPTLKK